MREKTIIEKMRNMSVEYKIQNLVLGDFIIGDIIIERKTLDDLSSSIMDGRYKEQKERLKNHPRSIYIVEGLNKTNNHGISYETLLSAMISIMIRDNIFVMRSTSLEETVKLLVLIDKKNENEFVETVKYDRKKQIEPDEAVKEMLSCIPGINNKIASKISLKFDSVSELVYYLNSGKDLREINGIGDKIAGLIYKYMHGINNI